MVELGQGEEWTDWRRGQDQLWGKGNGEEDLFKFDNSEASKLGKL